MLRIFKQIFLNIFGQSIFQKFWQGLFKLSLLSMNIGGGSNFKESGEERALKFVLSKLPSNSKLTFFDVGANVGGYSEMLLTQLKEINNQYKIFAFDPAKENIDLLNNKFKNEANVKIIPYGIGETNGNVTLYSDSPNSGLASLYKRNLEFVSKDMNQSQQVQIISLDEFCKDNQIEKIDFLKMDIEGHEFSALKGAQRLLANKGIKFIQFEFGGANIDSRTYFKDFYYLLEPNFEIYRILKHGLYRIDRYAETSEVFLTSNFLAISKQ